jgi:hypothetical protein
MGRKGCIVESTFQLNEADPLEEAPMQRMPQCR